MAADLRDHLPATEQRRGAIDKRRSPIEGIRRDTVHPHLRMLRCALGSQAQRKVLFGRIGRIGRRFGWPLLCGNTVLLEGLFLLIPGAELRGGLIEGKAHGDRERGGHHHEKDETLAPEIAPAFFSAEVTAQAHQEVNHSLVQNR